MKILSRVGSSVILEAKDGSIWLTKRKKLRHNNRRKKQCKPYQYKFRWLMVYRPIKQLS